MTDSTPGTASTSLLAALEYAKNGRPVVPLHDVTSGKCSCNDAECKGNPKRWGKHPRTANGLKGATTDLEQIRKWWGRWPTANVGSPTGKASRVWVLDADDSQGLADLDALQAENEPLPATYTTETGGKGQHLHFLDDTDGAVTNKQRVGGLKIDVRGTGGYCILPPSANGRGPYTVLDAREPVPAPQWLINFVTDTNRPKPKPSTNESHTYGLLESMDRARKYLAKIPGAVQGDAGSNPTFYAARVLVHGFNLSDEMAFRLLRDEYNPRCVPEWNDKQLRHKVEDAGTKPFNKPCGWLLDAERDGQPPGQKKKGPTEPQGDFEPNLICLADVQSVAVPWLWGDRIPLGRLTLLVGRPGGGKTFFTMWLASHLSQGLEFPDRAYGVCGDTIIMNAEDDPADTLKPRLEACGADCSRIHVLPTAKATGADGKVIEKTITLADLPIIEAALKRLPDVKLVVVDPIGSFMGGGVDSHRDNEVRGMLAPLAELASRYDVAVLLVAHTRKSPGDSADDLALGSRAFVGIARAVWHLSRDPEDRDRRFFLPGKQNLGRPRDGLAFRIEGEPAAVVWEAGEVDMNADDALAAEARSNAEKRKPGPTADKRMQAAQWLGEQLATGPKTPKELEESAEKSGHTWRTIQRAAKELHVETYKASFGGGNLWRLPGDQPRQEADPEQADAPRTANNLASWRDWQKQGENANLELGVDATAPSAPELGVDGVAPEQGSEGDLPVPSTDPPALKKRRRFSASSKTKGGAE